jgi:hypothetical protein
MIMKKNYTALLFFFSMLLAVQGFSQSPRMVFIEEATQASCPPCAALNPALQARVNANPDKVVFMAYQVWWPGFDPMYLDNSAEVDVRVGEYYQYGFAPQIVMQGSFVTGSGDPGALGNLTQAKIDAINGETSEFDMVLDAAIENGILKVSGNVTATADVSGDLKLRIAIIEHVISIEDAPGGTNGETEYHNVFKKFIGGTDGFDLADAWVAGDAYTIDETFDLSTLNIYNYAEVQVIAFVQNDANKFVHQAAQVKDLAITVDYDNNSSALSIVELPTAVCIGPQEIAPVVTIQNGGNADLTSVDIVYSINGGTAQTYQWTGSLTTLEKEKVTLDAYSFSALATNTIEVTLQNPNGVADEDASDNNVTASVAQAPESSTEISIIFNFDCWPEENTWEMRNSAGVVVAEGGPYGGMAQGTTTETLSLDPDECHTFVFMDQYGDGMHGSQWGAQCTVDGNITIIDDSGNNLYYYDGSYDVSEESSAFSTTWVNKVDEVALNGSISLTPNPTSGILKVQLDQSIKGETNIQVFSLDGKLVQGQTVENASELILDLSNNNNGIYLVRIVNGEKAATQRVTVQK